MLKKILALLAMLYAAASFAAVDVNKATPAELDAVKGIGPAISGKIVDERKKGDFKDWQDFIDRVKGVGDKNAAKFSAEGLTVNGASFKGAAPKAEDKKAAPTTAAASAPKADMKPAAAASAAKDDKMDSKAEAKAKKEADKKAKAEEKAKKAEEAKAKKEEAKEAKPAASAASAASAKK